MFSGMTLDLWPDEYAFLNAPGQAQIQSDLFYDHRANFMTNHQRR